MNYKTLNKLDIGQSGYIVSNSIIENKRHFLNLGITCGNIIKVLYQSPFKDPRAYLIKNTVLAIRDDDAKNIVVDVVDQC